MEKFDTKKALMEHHPINEMEATAIRETLRFLNDNLDTAFKRENQAGHITGSALVVDSKGNILLNHHKKANIWIQFGGHSDGEANTRAVALREVKEETGISNLKILGDEIFYCAVYNIPAGRDINEPAHKHYDINFLIQALDTDFTVSKESTQLRWCTPQEALKIVAGDTACTQMILKSQQYFNNKKHDINQNISTQKIENSLFL